LNGFINMCDMEKSCKNCKWLESEDHLKPCYICNSNYDMFEVIEIVYDSVEKIDSRGAEILLLCLNEVITGLEWRIENEPTTLDKADYEKYDEWTKTLRNYPSEFWTSNMKGL